MEQLKWADQGHSAEAAEFKCDIALTTGQQSLHTLSKYGLSEKKCNGHMPDTVGKV